MFYEEMTFNGITCCRHSPDGEWVVKPITKEVALMRLYELTHPAEVDFNQSLEDKGREIRTYIDQLSKCAGILKHALGEARQELLCGIKRDSSKLISLIDSALSLETSK